MSHQSFDKIWKCLIVERLHLAKLLLKELKTKETELYKRALELNKNENLNIIEEKEQENYKEEKQQEAIVFKKFDNLDLLNELSEIEKERRFSDSDENEESEEKP